MAVLSERGNAMLDKLPPYLSDDDMIQRLVDAWGRELQRIEDFLDVLREKLRPQNADDEYGILGLWERVAEIPIEPVGVSLSARRNRLMAALRRRSVGIGEGWSDLITLLLGTEGWEHDENNPTPYKMQLEIPFPSTSYQAGALEALLRRITPAHIQMFISYSDTFRVGISEVGDPL